MPESEAGMRAPYQDTPLSKAKNAATCQAEGASWEQEKPAWTLRAAGVASGHFLQFRQRDETNGIPALVGGALLLAFSRDAGAVGGWIARLAESAKPTAYSTPGCQGMENGVGLVAAP